MKGLGVRRPTYLQDRACMEALLARSPAARVRRDTRPIRRIRDSFAPHGRDIVSVRFKGPSVRASFDIASSADIVTFEVVTTAGTQTFTRRSWQTWNHVLRDVELSDGDCLRIVVANSAANARTIEVRIAFTRCRRREHAPARGFFAGRRARSRRSSGWNHADWAKPSAKRKSRARRRASRPCGRVRPSRRLRGAASARRRRDGPVARHARPTRADADPPRIAELARARFGDTSRFTPFAATRCRSRRRTGLPTARGPPSTAIHGLAKANPNGRNRR